LVEIQAHGVFLLICRNPTLSTFDAVLDGIGKAFTIRIDGFGWIEDTFFEYEANSAHIVCNE